MVYGSVDRPESRERPGARGDEQQRTPGARREIGVVRYDELLRGGGFRRQRGDRSAAWLIRRELSEESCDVPLPPGHRELQPLKCWSARRGGAQANQASRIASRSSFFLTTFSWTSSAE